MIFFASERAVYTSPVCSLPHLYLRLIPALSLCRQVKLRRSGCAAQGCALVAACCTDWLPGAPGNEALSKHSCVLYQQDNARPHAGAAPGGTRQPVGRRGRRAAGRCYLRRTSTTASSSRPAPGSRPSTSVRTTRLDMLGWRTTWPTLTPTHSGRSCTSSLLSGETPTASRPSCCTAERICFCKQKE